MRSIFIKEVSSFFSSVVGYVAVIVFLIACGLFLWVLPDGIMDGGYASLDQFFSMAPWVLLFLIPAITMRSFSDEFRGGTIEWLSTKPLTDMDIITGKYLASLALVIFALLPTLIYVYTIGNLSMIEHNLDSGGIIGSYIGLLFLAASFASVGIFCSSLSANQVVGFLISVLACMFLYGGFEAISKLPAFEEGMDYYLGMIGMSLHYNSISRGVIDTRDVIYFLSIIILFISLTRLSINSRSWDTARQD
jgi:ABC-2 type transport system permease protein